MLAVSDILTQLSGRKTIQARVPFLQLLLTLLAYLLWEALGRRVYMKLTPNRGKKLFANTDYTVISDDVDSGFYNSGHGTTYEILKLVAEVQLRND